MESAGTIDFNEDFYSLLESKLKCKVDFKLHFKNFLCRTEWWFAASDKSVDSFFIY
jgi:hypothetical protein